MCEEVIGQVRWNGRAQYGESGDEKADGEDECGDHGAGDFSFEVACEGHGGVQC